jgi:hypothetical protein
MHFIVSTDVKKADPETRKLIRSHVMQGKNRAKSRPAKQPSVESRAIMVDPNQTPRVVSLEEIVETCHSFIPKRVGTDLSLTKFAAEITPAMFGDVVHCQSLPITTPKHCIE